ncbi:MAG: nucleotidyltransferase domain-containing protein [Thermodesulfobacteriota bacterium]|nr:nucleotidyltransferase domain-containing protein [Thermodesulfobacteriota bacterium]
MNARDVIIKASLKYYPDLQAIYLFGTYGTDEEWPDSDVDIALLLPWKKSKEAGSLMMSDLRFELESLLNKDVDLINLREVSTVLQKEVIVAGRRIYCADEYATDEFEMLVLSYYQKLSEERRDILQSFFETRRAFNV